MRVRALIVVACLWAVAWSLVGTALSAYAWATWSVEVMEWPRPGLRTFARPVLQWMLWGGVCGGIFAFVLMIAERRSSIEDLLMRRVAAWGAIAAVVIAQAQGAFHAVRYPGSEWFEPAVLLIGAILGAISAVGTLALARRTRVR